MWNESIFPFFPQVFFFPFQGHTNGPARTSGPINFVVLHCFDVLPSRHLRRLSLDPCYTSSLLFHFFCSLLIVLLTAVLPCSAQTSGNEATLPFSRRAPAWSSTPQPLSGRRLQNYPSPSFFFSIWKVGRWHGSQMTHLPESERFHTQDLLVFFIRVCSSGLPYLASEQQMFGS